MTLCKHRGCANKSRNAGPGYCFKHYTRWWKYGNSSTVKGNPPICTVRGCNNSTRNGSRGWCIKHYARWRKRGDVHDAGRRGMKPLDTTICAVCRVQLNVPVNWTRSLRRQRAFICVPCRRSRCNRSRKHNPARTMFDSSKSRARKKGLPFNLTKGYVQELMQSTPICPALRIKLNYKGGEGFIEESPTMDRFDNSKGYVIGNVSIISRKANMMKLNGSPEDARRLAEWMTCVEATGDLTPITDKQLARLTAQIMSAQP